MMNIFNFEKLYYSFKIKRLKKKTQIYSGVDLHEDRLREIAEYYNLTPEKIVEIFNGPNQHEFFDDISTDKKLLRAYQARSKKATIGHMLSYNRFDQAIYLLNFCNKQYERRHRSSVRVLDYGCSIADYGLAFALAGYSVTLCDIASGNIDVGKWRFARRNLGYDCIEIELDNLYPTIEDMDVVIAGEVLEHIRDPGVVIKNIYNGLRKNGFFWSSGYPATVPELGDRHPDHLVEAAKMRERVLEYLESGFKKIEITCGHLYQKT